VTGRLYTAAPSRVQHQSKLKDAAFRRAAHAHLQTMFLVNWCAELEREAVHAGVSLTEVSEDAPAQVLWHPQLPGPVQQECKDLVPGAAPPGSITVLRRAATRLYDLNRPTCCPGPGQRWEDDANAYAEGRAAGPAPADTVPNVRGAGDDGPLMGVPELPSACFRTAAAQWSLCVEQVCGSVPALPCASSLGNGCMGAGNARALATGRVRRRAGAADGRHQLQSLRPGRPRDRAARVEGLLCEGARPPSDDRAPSRALAPAPAPPFKCSSAWHEHARHERDVGACRGLRWTRLCSWWMRSTGSASPSRRRSWTRC